VGHDNKYSKKHQEPKKIKLRNPCDRGISKKIKLISDRNIVMGEGGKSINENWGTDAGGGHANIPLKREKGGDGGEYMEQSMEGFKSDLASNP